MFFDAHVDARALGPRDLADLRFFGVRGCLSPSGDAPGAARADAVRAEWEALSRPVLRRLRRAGLAGYAALGLHPRFIPRRGLEALLSELPAFLGRPGVVALGAIGLDEGGELEEECFRRQLALARELRLPVLVHTPRRDKVRATRRALGILREAELDPGRVLVDHADARTVRAVRGWGFQAGLSLSAGAAGPSDGVDAVVRLVASLGPDGLVLSSDGGGGGDLLALARAADRMSRAGLSDAVVRRVCGQNALDWLGLEPGAVAAGAGGAREAARPGGVSPRSRSRARRATAPRRWPPCSRSRRR